MKVLLLVAATLKECEVKGCSRLHCHHGHCSVKVKMALKAPVSAKASHGAVKVLERMWWLDATSENWAKKCGGARWRRCICGAKIVESHVARASAAFMGQHCSWSCLSVVPDRLCRVR